MIRLKSEADITTMSKGGAILAEILRQVTNAAVPGVTPHELDQLSRDLIARYGTIPSFLHYSGHKGEPGFPAALCVSVNEGVVHGLPGMTPLQQGDVVGLDLGLIYEGLFLDHATTVGIGKVSPEAERLIRVTREALQRGIAAARSGNRIGDVGAAIQQYVEGEGLAVVRQLVGHGVGYAVHEPPKVPNFGRAGKGEELTPGLVIAIEPMVVMGDPMVRTASDDWTVITVDGGLAAHEEHTVAVTENGPRILTT